MNTLIEFMLWKPTFFPVGYMHYSNHCRIMWIYCGKFPISFQMSWNRLHFFCSLSASFHYLHDETNRIIKGILECSMVRYEIITFPHCSFSKWLRWSEEKTVMNRWFTTFLIPLEKKCVIWYSVFDVSDLFSYLKLFICSNIQ